MNDLKFRDYQFSDVCFEVFMEELNLSGLYRKDKEIFDQIIETLQRQEFSGMDFEDLFSLANAVRSGEISEIQMKRLIPLFDVRDPYSDEEYLVALPLQCLALLIDPMESIRKQNWSHSDKGTQSSSFL